MNLNKSIKDTILNFLNPFRLVKIIKLQRNRKNNNKKKVQLDPQLKLYADVLKNDFLHYGYFEDTNKDPRTISLKDIDGAQLDYAKLFLAQITDTQNPVLDIGCGMGGLIKLLLKHQYLPVGITPDEHQVQYICQKYQNVEMHHCKFEDFKDHSSRFGTLITSESLQYLKLDQALPLIQKIMLPNGKWLICDYFRTQNNAFEKSGHQLDTFLNALKTHNLNVTYQKDITQNVAVTLDYLYYMAQNLGLPVLDFLTKKYEIKAPGFYFASQKLVKGIDDNIKNGIEVINPKRFLAEKKYIFMVVERA